MKLWEILFDFIKDTEEADIKIFQWIIIQVTDYQYSVNALWLYSDQWCTYETATWEANS
jgi:hypothetical protein